MPSTVSTLSVGFAPLGLFLGGRVGFALTVAQGAAVPFHPGDVGVVAGDLRPGGVPAAGEKHFYIEDVAVVRLLYGAVQFLQTGGDLLDLRRGHPGEHLQLSLRSACGNARRRRGADAPQPAGIGHHYALHVLDDIGAGPDPGLLRPDAQA